LVESAPIKGSPMSLRIVPNKAVQAQQTLHKLKPIIGIEIATMSDGRKGVRVLSIREGRAADLAGVTKDHFVTKVNAVFIETNMVFELQTKKKTPGDILPFVLLDAKTGKVTTKNVEVGTLGKTIEEVREIRRQAGITEAVWDREMHSSVDFNTAKDSPRLPAFYGGSSPQVGSGGKDVPQPGAPPRRPSSDYTARASPDGTSPQRDRHSATASTTTKSSQLRPPADATANSRVSGSSGRARPQSASISTARAAGIPRAAASVRPLKSFEDKAESNRSSKGIRPQRSAGGLGK